MMIRSRLVSSTLRKIASRLLSQFFRGLALRDLHVQACFGMSAMFTFGAEARLSRLQLPDQESLRE